MPTLYKNSAEGGTHLTTVTAGNSGSTSGDAFTAVAKGTSSTIQFNNSHPAHGSMGFYLNHASGDSSYFEYTPPSDATPTYAAREYLLFTANPGANDQFIMQFRNTSTSVLTICVATSGKLKILDAAGSTIYTATTACSTSTQYRVEAKITKGTTTGDGVVNFAYYPGDSLTATETFNSTTANVGTLDIAKVRYGRGGTIASVWDYYLDDLALQTGATALIGPVANVPPTATITANQNVAASAAVTVSVSASDSDGTIASYAWTGTRYSTTGAPASITLTGSTTATVTYTASSATTGILDVLTCVVTDNGGATVTKTTEVRVATTGALNPLYGYDATAASWTLIGSPASVGAALGDGSSTTRIESPDITSTPQQQFVRLAPGSTRTSLRVTLTAAVLTGAVTNTNKVRVYTGATQAAEHTTATFKKVSDNSTSDVTLSDLDLYFDLTSGEIAAITDWGFVSIVPVPVV